MIGCASAPPAAADRAPRAATASVDAARTSARSRSDAAAERVVGVLADFTPEELGQMGVVQRDEGIVDLGPRVDERYREAAGRLRDEIVRQRADERDAFVQQDLDILSHRLELDVRESETEERSLLPYHSVAKAVFVGLRALLDDAIPPERRRAALVRLRKYTGDFPGTTPLTELAAARTRERLGDRALLGPVKGEVEKDLADGPTYRAGIAQLFAKYQLPADALLARLGAQLDAYDAFVRAEILPRARVDFRLPPAVYALQLEDNGIDLPPATLAADARRAFAETEREMDELAPQVAEAKGLRVRGRLDVLRALKAEQIQGDAVLPLYERRIADLEAIIRRERLVTLPTRPMRFRVATAAETAREPAPHLDLQGVFGHANELTFVLPMRVSDAGAAAAAQYDDFTFEAASWTLTAHEGRPGHDLQMTAMSERGVSLARKLFAFNAVNVEGWALYAEHITRPFMPVDGRFVSLQFLLLREARAFLDPELQAGKVTMDEARRVLRDEVGISEAFTKEELDRFTFQSPGQAPSYYLGYTRMLALRRAIEQAKGKEFDARRFHDVVLAQGLLPPDLLARAVREALR